MQDRLHRVLPPGADPPPGQCGGREKVGVAPPLLPPGQQREHGAALLHLRLQLPGRERHAAPALQQHPAGLKGREVEIYVWCCHTSQIGRNAFLPKNTFLLILLHWASQRNCCTGILCISINYTLLWISIYLLYIMEYFLGSYSFDFFTFDIRYIPILL